MLCDKCSSLPVPDDRGMCRKCRRSKAASSFHMYCEDCSIELGICEGCGEEGHAGGSVEAQRQKTDDVYDFLGTFILKVDESFNYVLWFDTPLGKAGQNKGSFVLTEDYDSGETGSGNKDYNGHWELKKTAKGPRLELFPETVEEVILDSVMMEGEQETRYKYSGEFPMIVTLQEIMDGKVKSIILKAFDKELIMTRQGDENE